MHRVNLWTTDISIFLIEKLPLVHLLMVVLHSSLNSVIKWASQNAQKKKRNDGLSEKDW